VFRLAVTENGVLESVYYSNYLDGETGYYSAIKRKDVSHAVLSRIVTNGEKIISSRNVDVFERNRFRTG
jgi:hypothetical protein